MKKSANKNQGQSLKMLPINKCPPRLSLTIVDSFEEFLSMLTDDDEGK
jgi:hypothetical protein